METIVKTRAMVEVALMSALIVVMTILSNYLSLAFVICTALAPIIVAVMYYRNGMKYGASCAIVSAVLSSILFNPMTAIPMAISYTLVGMTLGYSITKGYSPGRIILLITICGSIALVLEVVLASFFMGIANPVVFLKRELSSMITMMNETMEETKSMASSLGLPEESMKSFDQISQSLNINMFMALVPASVVLASFVQGILCMKIFEYISKRILKKDFERLDMARIYIPNLAGAALIAVAAILTILSNKGFTNLNYVLIALIISTMFLMILNGMCTIEFYLKNKMHLPPPLRLIIIVLVMFMAPFLYIILGFAEMIFDFRRLDPHRIRKA